ncbi:hypothetical protein KP509_20G009300 [Ceratopteris richardii]|uniref:glutathione transferase n=1 Tax=Ceratopteris richardii TaxID=49495 RepID=A0A8T2SG64_CERRI|nr:hypothetical protein KP509_20G009300 [Ceratopteris richardii]
METTGEMSEVPQTLKLLSAWPSMFCMRVLIALKLKRLDYEYQEEDLLNKSQFLLSSNPVHKKVPVLIHNDKPLCESLIIVQYIDEVWPSPPTRSPIVPADPYDRAIARFWADYVDNKFHEAAARLMRSPEGELQEQAKKDMLGCLAVFDELLRDLSLKGPFFGGQHIGLVDIALAPYLCWLHAFETIGAFKLLDEGRCPHLCKWANDVLENPCVKEALAIAPAYKVLEFTKVYRSMALGHE